MQTRLFIGGDFVDAAEGATIEVRNPADGSVLADVAEARAPDVDRAVAAAAAALDGPWGRMASAERGRLLLRLADAIETNADRLASLETRDTGHPIRDSTALDVPRTAATFRYFGGMADKVQGAVVPVEPGFLNYVTREPLGVIGQIVPWNFPIMFCSWKMGPALAAGNTVVLKPSELTPLTALAISELVAEVGFPPGVVNVVPGYGHAAGQHLAAHSGVAKLAFTGSTATGRKIVEASAGNLKRLQLELGGKGANIVFEDADIDAAVNGSAFAIFHNQGQACIAGSRLLLHASIAERFLDRFLALARSIKVGDPLDPTTEMGPLTSPAHRDRVLSYVKVAEDEGGEVLVGGVAPDDPALAAGCYVLPTVVAATAGARVCREEVFGPFVTVTRFDDEDEVVRIANGTQYGLGSGLWTRDLSRAHRVAALMRTGMVWINSYKRVNPGSPFGGVGESGYGREMGFEAMHDYTDAKSVWVNVDARLRVVSESSGKRLMAELMTLSDAVKALVHDGDTIALEGFTHLIPHAAGHEIIRQRRRDLTLVRMTPDLVYDQMIGAGAARRLVFSWGGNPGVGSLHRLRDAVENAWPGPLEIEEHSHAGMATRYMAGAAGLPFGILRGYVGTDLAKHTSTIATIRCPFTCEELTAVPALRPDVAIVHAQQADRRGNILLRGIVGVQKEAVLASTRSIVTVEEVVDTLDAHMNSVILPGWIVSAVCEVPGGAHPSYADGYYMRDNAYYAAWDAISRDRDRFLRWLDRCVYGTADWAEEAQLRHADGARV